jgi:diguanylate cyclase (GGDEF)-like protein
MSFSGWSGKRRTASRLAELPISIALLAAVGAGFAWPRGRRVWARSRRAARSTVRVPEVLAAENPPLPSAAAAAGPSPGSLEYEVLRALRHNHPLSMLVAKPDDIQRYARRGGQALVQLLEAVGRAIEESLRATDIASRQGEHEFWVILPETSNVSARVVAERIRLGVGGRETEIAPGELVSLSLSIGIAAFPDDALSGDAIVLAAQRALARAVQLGGNRTVMHSVPAGAPSGWGIAAPSNSN